MRAADPAILFPPGVDGIGTIAASGQEPQKQQEATG
jgi:hypothetical protein